MSFLFNWLRPKTKIHCCTQPFASKCEEKSVYTDELKD